jgi:SAM-dependent methyltransferase
MPFEENDDVPSGVDFHDPQQARDWTHATPKKRPYRRQFFAAFSNALSHLDAPRILELGSGPGHLARELLERMPTTSYTALDFSVPMHELARAHLGPLAERVTFLLRDFRDPAWPAGLGPFDAIVTLQAAHETRHKRHLVPLFERARTALVPGGLLLYADHYAAEGTHKPNLMPDRDEQPLALERAGFTAVRLVHEEGGMALYSATA